MFNLPKPNTIKDWTCILESSHEYEINLAQSYLTDHEIPAQILSKRDSAYSLVVGEMAMIYLYVPDSFVERATELMDDITEDDE